MRPVPKISVDTATSPNVPEQESRSAISPNAGLRPHNPSYLSVSPIGVPRSPTGSFHSSSASIGGSTLHSSLDVSSVKLQEFNDDEDDSEALRAAIPSNVPLSAKPFAFSPTLLNSFLDPKSLPAFKATGGLHGLQKGLLTNIETGLDEQETKCTTTVTFEEATSHVVARKHNRDRANSAVSAVSCATTIVDAGSPTTSTQPNPERDFYVINGRPVPSNSPHDEELGRPLPPPENQFEDRKRVFGDNRLPKKRSKKIHELMWEAYKDPFILVLTGAAVISLALGLYETFGVAHDPDAPIPVDWVEGVAIVAAIIIVVVVSAGNDWQKERQFAKLNRQKENRSVQVVRGGRVKEISVYDILVGDILTINQGDLIPVDGIVLESIEIKCDESSATGESDAIKKMSGQDVYDRIANTNVTKASRKLDPFVISGSKVLEGTGKYLVTSVGVNSSYGKIMMSLRQESEKTPLQVKLEGFAGAITKFGLGSAVLLLLVLTIKFVASLPGNDSPAAQKASTFLDILIVAVTVIVVAVPEGLPLAVTLALAYATTRMLKDNNLVRVLRACETMGNATTVCSDKTGTLTQNKMTVVAGLIGNRFIFAHSQEKPAAMGAAFGELSEATKEVIKESVILNSTATNGESSGVFNGSKTETALLSMVDDYIGIGSPLAGVRSKYQAKQIFPFDSDRKCMGIVVKVPSGYRLYVKGASEILLNRCTSYVADVRSKELSLQELTESDREFFSMAITEYAQRSLRTIGLVYRDFPQWPPAGVKTLPDSQELGIPKVDFDSIFYEMNLFAIVGIQDPLRPGVPEAVRDCARAGVTVRMVTGDNVETAKAIAKECGIYDPSAGHTVMEGPEFRKLKDNMEKMRAEIVNLRVLARSSPEDKKILVKALKDMGEIVAVTGDGTNDGPALKMADVGFSMGIAGTEVAKEASSIILMDDNFSSIVKAIMWGRAVNDAVQKFLQFQLTVNITAVLLTFVSAVASSEMTSVLTAVQLLWVNLIMDTFAALALATDAPTPSILNRKPASKKSPLVTLRMWKMITGQAILQLTITLALHFGGTRLFGYSHYNTTGQKTLEYSQLETMVFNTFVWMQIANQFNSRRLDNGWNIFENIHKNKFFLFINCVMFAGQIAIIFVGGRAFGIVPLKLWQWGVCLGLALLSLPWAVVIRAIPDRWVESLWKKVGEPVFGVVGGALEKVFGPIGRGLKRAYRKVRPKKEVEEVSEASGKVKAVDIEMETV